MRAKLTGAFILIPWLLLLMGCNGGSDQTSRWPVSRNLVTPESLSSITNGFLSLGHPFTFRTVISSNYQFALVCRYPHSGLNTFEVYCFELIGNDGWYFRNTQLMHFSDSMNITVQTNQDGILVSHDGFPLSEIRSLAEQYARKRQARTNDMSNRPRDTNRYIISKP